uniref:Immunoglobulin V-set domain-containing protein n=1 Tax=Gouania willdenowi TaxID=441366 RepID=A0A8C5DJ57_GOUWI
AIHQTPPDLFRKQNQTAEIHCSHTIDNYDQILWYKQSVDGSFQLLGYMLTNSANPEPGMAVKMKGGASKGQICTLILEELHLSSSAVYYCACRYHSVTCHCFTAQKPVFLPSTPAGVGLSITWLI